MGKSGEDQYGQVHPEETTDLVSSKLQDLEVEIAKIPQEERVAYEEAKTKCPEQLTTDFKLKFLRCEVFNADLAALRLVKYWSKRVEIFGSERAFLPLTQDQALKDDSLALGMGFFQLMPVKDPSGRSLMFVDPSRQDKTKYERESMCRSLWYVLHAALEDEETQKKGAVFVAFPQNARLSQLDRGLAKLNIESIKGCIPVRLTGVHICHPPGFFQIVFSIFKMFLGERLRKRIRIHYGSEKHVLKRLEGFGLSKDKLPTELGGDISMDHEAWLEERKRNEN